MTDVIIVFGFLSFSILILMLIMATVFIIGLLVIFGPSYLIQKIKLVLRSDISFMRWLYGDKYEKQMPVKLYSEGWRKGDYE